MDKKQKATINFINKNDNKCFQYAATLALNHKETGKDSERIKKIKPFIDQIGKIIWHPTNFSKHNSKCKKQVILLINLNREE